jgi:hypothetical protein
LRLGAQFSYTAELPITSGAAGGSSGGGGEGGGMEVILGDRMHPRDQKLSPSRPNPIGIKKLKQDQ